jgi:hypothetical protein
MFPPERIVCLTEETVETLYLPGSLSEPEQSVTFSRPFPPQKPASLLSLLRFATEC